MLCMASSGTAKSTWQMWEVQDRRRCGEHGAPRYINVYLRTPQPPKGELMRNIVNLIIGITYLVTVITFMKACRDELLVIAEAYSDYRRPCVVAIASPIPYTSTCISSRS